MTRNPNLPLQDELEARYQAKIVTYTEGGCELPGGMCRCCGCGPNVEPDYQSEPWYIYVANLCDTDGVFYSSLCQECLEEVRQDLTMRPPTERDLLGREVSEMMGDDIDGAQTTMDDLEGLDLD